MNHKRLFRIPADAKRNLMAASRTAWRCIGPSPGAAVPLRALTWTGTLLLALVPLPSWPKPLEPQAQAVHPISPPGLDHLPGDRHGPGLGNVLQRHSAYREKQTLSIQENMYVSSILRLGPLRSLDLAHLRIHILPHSAGIGFGRPGGSEA